MAAFSTLNQHTDWDQRIDGLPMCAENPPSPTGPSSARQGPRHPWTPEEDDRLRQLVARFGQERWAFLASQMEGRVGRQCRERWVNHLSPVVRKDPWTREEDMILIEAHERFGNSWTKLSRLLRGRPENQIKNRWHRLRRTTRGHPIGSIGETSGTSTSPPPLVSTSSPDSRTAFHVPSPVEVGRGPSTASAALPPFDGAPLPSLALISPPPGHYLPPVYFGSSVEPPSTRWEREIPTSLPSTWTLETPPAWITRTSTHASSVTRILPIRPPEEEEDTGASIWPPRTLPFPPPPPPPPPSSGSQR